jgi:hypothetical protein
MSVERIRLLHEDYIRVTERFKTVWTFQQFLHGVHQTFLSGEPEPPTEFPALYEEIRSIAGRIDSTPSPDVRERLQKISRCLDAITGSLRESDRNVSPSFVRRFFERVRPENDKTALQLLRFYFSQPAIDPDVVDKVNFLATVAAAGSCDPSSSAARPRQELRRLFDSVTCSAVWPRPTDQDASAVAYAVAEVSAKLARAETFEELTGRGLLDEFRAIKRKVGASLVHPEVLTAIACGNLSTRAVFYRLYHREERMLDEATSRIGELERELRRGAGDHMTLPEEIRLFRETRDQFRRRALDSNVRAADVLQLKAAIGQVLQKFDPDGNGEAAEVVGAVEGANPSFDEEAFWDPLVGRILEAVLSDDGKGALPTDTDGLAQFRLDPWELKTARRVVAAGGESRSDRDRTILRAVALRRKAEEETEILRTTAEDPRSLEILRRARGSIARSPDVDASICQMIAVAHDAKLSEQTRAWTRTRFRLLRAIADLWLMQDQPRTDRRTK